MKPVYICDAIRTPVGRYGGSLAAVRPDDLAAHVIRVILARSANLDHAAIDDVILGCANQAGEDNRNVARMAALLAGLPVEISGVTVNRLCGSGMDAVATAARAIAAGETEVVIAGGVESMSRAPFVMGKATEAFSRKAEVYDTTIGWRFVNDKMKSAYGTDAMPETAENLAKERNISREDQDKFALWSQSKASAAQADGRLAEEIAPVSISQRKGDPIIVSVDEHPRATSLDKLASLKPIVHPAGTITAGNASGVNDGAAAVLVAGEEAVKRFDLKPMARIVGAAAAGVPPRIMGIGPVPATRKLLARLGLSLDDLQILEFNEAFAAQALACTRELGLADDDARLNPRGGAIALGHPLGMSGARLVTTAAHQLQRTGAKRALCTMCIGVGQGISMVLEQP
ncbi:MAG: 3-oxoadipyl-CoA thiolase [Candidatus Sumerlaeaceae bacterium]|nr:3-oxoadipyl-CoA thiolase [Candidatus Sumerlaeaceae bacterium]